MYKKHLQKVKYLSITKFYYLPNDNILGRKIGTLAEGIKPAGNHQAIWDAGGQASGIYFYRIKAGDKVETRKMVVMKYSVQPLTHFRGRYHTALCFWNAIVKLMFPPRSPAIIVLLRVWDPKVKRVLAIYKSYRIDLSQRLMLIFEDLFLRIKDHNQVKTKMPML